MFVLIAAIGMFEELQRTNYQQDQLTKLGPVQASGAWASNLLCHWQLDCHERIEASAGY